MLKLNFFWGLAVLLMLFLAVFFLPIDSASVRGQSTYCTDPKPADGTECSAYDHVQAYTYVCVYGDAGWYWKKNVYAGEDCNIGVCWRNCEVVNGTARCVADTADRNCHFECAGDANRSECAWVPGAPDPNNPLACTTESFGQNSSQCFSLRCVGESSTNPYDSTRPWPASCKLVPKTSTVATIPCSQNRDCVYTNCYGIECVFSSKTSVGVQNQCKYGSQDTPSAGLGNCYKVVCRNKKCTKVANSQVTATDVLCRDDQEGQELSTCKKTMCGGTDGNVCLTVAVEDTTLKIPCNTDTSGNPSPESRVSRECQYTRCVSSGGDSNNVPTCELATKTVLTANQCESIPCTQLPWPTPLFTQTDTCKYGSQDPSSGLPNCYKVVCRDKKCTKVANSKVTATDILCDDNQDGQELAKCKKSMCDSTGTDREKCIYVAIENTSLTIPCTDKAGVNEKSRDCQVTKCESTECKLVPKTSANEQNQCKYGTDNRSQNLPNCYYLKCKGNVCEKTVGQGTNQCTVDSNSKPSGDCQYIACASATTSNCTIFSGTRVNNIEDPGCTVTGTAGGNFTCANTADGTAVDYTRCVNKNPGNICQHLGCDTSSPYSCKYLPGKGGAQCTTNPNSCVHRICQGKTCTTVPITQPGTVCSSDTGCKRNVCRGMTCTEIPIDEARQGDISCTNVDNCRYLKCESDGSCAYSAKVTGTETDQCIADSHGAVVRACQHLDCGGNALRTQCVYVPGRGDDLCQGGDHPNPNLPRCSHFGCDISNSCTELPGPAGIECNPNDEHACQHRDCSNRQCIYIDGQGADRCGPNSNPVRNCCSAQSECPPTVPSPTGAKRCSAVGLEKEYEHGACDLTIGCTIKKYWELETDCPLRCINSYACSGTKVVGTKNCTGCKDLSCTTWQEAMPGIDCAPASTSTNSWCTPGSNSVQCTLTAEYSGKCYEAPWENGNAKCESPTVEIVCSGPCSGDTDGDGIPDDQDPDDDNDGIPDELDPDPKNPNIPNPPSNPPEEPCEDVTCPDGSIVGCNDECPKECTKICPDGSKVDCSAECPSEPPKPPCTETCPDGSVVPCGADCPECYISCSDGSKVICGEECPEPPEPPDEPPGEPPVEPPKNFCNENKKCTMEGDSGMECLEDKDCAYSCDKNYKCALNGGGAMCSKSSECLLEEPRCVLNNGVKQCRPDNCGGKNCSTDSECTDQPTYCDDTCGKCVPGGNTGIPCANDAMCEYGCNVAKQCVFGGAGGICNPYKNECEDQDAKCNIRRQCLKDDCGGADCSTNEDCQDLPTYCDDTCQRCVPGGDTGIPCFEDEECQIVRVPPEAKDLKVVPKPCTGQVSFQWTYSGSDKEIFARLEIDINPNFTSTNKITKDINYPTSNLNQALIPIKSTASAGSLKYGTTYYWHVRVQAVNGLDSGWTPKSPLQYKNAGRPDPTPKFVLMPTTSAPGGTVNFIESSTSSCYDAKGAVANCNSRSWNFDDNSSVVVTEEKTISHAYRLKGDYNPTLTLCDETNTCCTASQPLIVTPGGLKDMPIWKEISPF